MVDNLTLRIDAANAVTRIYAFVIQTSFRVRTIRIDNAFGLANEVRITVIASRTLARHVSIRVLAQSVRATSIFMAQISRRWRFYDTYEIMVY